ncbi:MAG TPA: hypothetical protein VFN81_08710 [Sphingomicrobium sp.]|nr:hypothetical protein [Sphingomicrobium sp.]
MSDPLVQKINRDLHNTKVDLDELVTQEMKKGDGRNRRLVGAAEMLGADIVLFRDVSEDRI